MKTLYFDCFSGAAGDMINAALIDLGVSVDRLEEELRNVPIRDYRLQVGTTKRTGLRGIKFDVLIKDEHHPERKLADILPLIEGSALPDPVKQMATRIFSRLGDAEAKSHGVSVDHVHFHEVGAIDAIVDIVGACIGFHQLGIQRFLCSSINVGRGMVGCSHGRMPVPVPATAELLKGAAVYSTDVEAELVTPTGAAIISTLCEGYGPLPEMRLEGVGYGAGTKEFADRPNMIRLMLGDTSQTSALSERVTVIESNIDDMSPEVYGYFMEKALAGGALDVFYTPVQMKKDRPATKLSVVCRKEDRERLIELIFQETTTIGLRYDEVDRRVLQRNSVEVHTAYGLIKVKVSYLGEKVVNVAPEYADCKVAAERHHVPLRDVMAAAAGAFEKEMGN